MKIEENIVNKKKKLTSSKLLFNRELSWLEFNDRVLREAMCPDVPLLERLKFLSIVSSNLDEFYMIRVAGLKQARTAGVRKKGPAGFTPAAQLVRITARVGQMVADQTRALSELVGELEKHGIHVLHPDQYTDAQERFLEEYFTRNVQPALSPMAMDILDPKPLLPHLRLHLAVLLEPTDQPESEPRFAVVPIPPSLPRFVTLPAGEGLHLVRVEDIVSRHAARLFPGHGVSATAVFRITRDSDVAVDDDESGDLLESLAQAVRERSRRNVVRLELSAGANRSPRKFLMNLFSVKTADVFEIDGMMDLRDLMPLTSRPGLESLRYEDWPAQPARDLYESEDMFASLRDHDVLLFHPYESFDPVIELVRAAASDPGVLAIKQTLYRTTGDSPIVAALVQAARNGKQVTVLVELKARFDEARNITWARALEDAGCDVIYGIAGLKTHAKMLLVVRREEYGVRRYLHLSTGNYNDKTARLYSDIGLMTTDRELTADAAAFFNLLTGYSQPVGWSKLTIAPTGLRQRILDLIEREIQSSTKTQPGLIIAKVNSLEDPELCRALYLASRAGVKIQLNVRGICRLRPVVEGVSENIEVISIIDRYLEHARIFYFRNGGHEEVYLSSADWMTRNLDKRLETLFPVTAPALRKRLVGILRTFFQDNVKARRLTSDGVWESVTRKGKGLRAQEVFYREAVETAQAAQHNRLTFQPLKKARKKKSEK
ncbi:MAG: polyphosphate kinase 1 [Phycisphaerae bacterium]|nr:polyphosphate kinase 1 [Phycisphaerae bacterium]